MAGALNWQRRLANTSKSYPGKGSFYTQYLIKELADDKFLCLECEYAYKNHEYVLQVTKRLVQGWGNSNTLSYEILKEFPHDGKYMKEAKALCQKVVEEL